MSNKQHSNNLEYKQGLIPVHKITPSPFQVRRFFDEDKLKELATTIVRDGLIEPIVVRHNNGRYEIIAGERRVRAIRDYTGIKAVPARIVEANDLEARRISGTENLQREDLSAIETAEYIVAIVDAELIKDEEYASMGKDSLDRVKTMLGKLDALRRSEQRGSDISDQSRRLSHKFMGQVEKTFKNLPKPLKWRSFYENDLPLLVDFCEEVREASIRCRLNRSQTRALEKLRAASEQEFHRVTAHIQRHPDPGMAHAGRDFRQPGLSELSAREIETSPIKRLKRKT